MTNSVEHITGGGGKGQKTGVPLMVRQSRSTCVAKARKNKPKPAGPVNGVLVDGFSRSSKPK